MRTGSLAARSFWKAARAAAKAVGKLAGDEMYTYVPALQLGGSSKTSKVQRVKAGEQLVILWRLAEIRRLL
jgi:hypothetical protein